MLGKIEPDGNNGHVDGPPECGGFDIAILWHLDAGGTAVVHTIKSAAAPIAKTADDLAIPSSL